MTRQASRKIKINPIEKPQQVMFEAMKYLTRRLQYYLEKNTKEGETRAYKTGFLSESWQAEVVKTEKGNISLKCYSDAPYSVYVEYGHATRDGRAWIKGKHIVQKSIADLKKNDFPKAGLEAKRLYASILFALGKGGHKGKDPKGYCAIDWWNGQRDPNFNQRNWRVSTKDD